jgi:hypothetical protein
MCVAAFHFLRGEEMAIASSVALATRSGDMLIVFTQFHEQFFLPRVRNTERQNPRQCQFLDSFGFLRAV